MPAGDLDRCFEFPCKDVAHRGYSHPDLPEERDPIRVIMISDTPPSDRLDPLNIFGSPLFRFHTLQAFRDAGYDVATMEDIESLGVYVTTAVKCPKLGYGLKRETISNCSFLLEAELAMFPNVRSILLMGDTAIRVINEIALRIHGAVAIPNGSAYKVKSREYQLGGVSLFPSYPQTGHNLAVEGDRQEIIAIDIRNALAVAGRPTEPQRQNRPHRERPRSPEPRRHEHPGESVGSTAV